LIKMGEHEVLQTIAIHILGGETVPVTCPIKFKGCVVALSYRGPGKGNA
jgi:hypothetical protein